MFNNTTLVKLFPTYLNSGVNESNSKGVALSTSIIVAVLAPVAVTRNALILAAIWKKTFARTPFHILLSGLAFTDLCTGLIAQPFYVARALMHFMNPMLSDGDRPTFAITIDIIGDCSAIYCLYITILLITLMSVERWLHLSRRSLVTSRRGCFAVIILFLLPTPIIVFSVLSYNKPTYKDHMRVASMVSVLTYYLTTSFAYFKVTFIELFVITNSKYKQMKQFKNFARPSIDLAKKYILFFSTRNSCFKRNFFATSTENLIEFERALLGTVET